MRVVTRAILMRLVVWWACVAAVSMSGVAVAHPVLGVVSHAMPVTDGLSVAAWPAGQDVRVLFDGQPVHEVVSVSLPSGCDFADLGAIGDGRLAYLCSSDGRDWTPELQDLRSRQVTVAPGGPAISRYMQQNSAHGEAFYLDAVGSELLQLHGESDKGAFVFFDALHSGRVFDAPPLDARHVLDPDSPSGLRRLCAPLRVAFHVTDESGAPHRVPDPAAFRSPYLATLVRGQAVLDRCASSRPVILGRAATPPVLTREYVAWSSLTKLTVMSLRTGARRSFVLRKPQAGTVVPLLAGTNRHLWLGYGKHIRQLDLARAR